MSPALKIKMQVAPPIFNLHLHFLSLFSFSFDPKERTTFWVMFIGGAFAILPLWSVNQTAVQRFLSAKSLKDAQR
jgi:uncharacterized sodium:solute symporter family permease YidK